MVYTTDANEVISIFMMLILYSFTYIYILKKIKMNMVGNILFFISVVLRICLTLIDTYLFYLPNSGMDSVVFENHAYNLLNGSMTLFVYNFDNYPKLIYVIYLLVGRKPLFIRAINGSLSLITGFLVYKSIFKITGDNRKSSNGMLCFLFFPQSLIFSSIIMRESFIVFFATLSVMLFIEYSYNKKMSYLYMSFGSLILGSLFHCGIILIAVAYIYFIFMDKTKGKINIKRSVLIVSILALSVLVILNSDIFLRKFGSFTSLESIINRINYANTLPAGSIYLNQYSINSLKDLILYIPFKVFYFLFSPMIWDVRGLQDIIAIFFDVIFYIVLVFEITKAFFEKSLDKKERLLIKTLIIAAVLVIGVYAMGTRAAGTAIRHRYKALSLLLIITFFQKGGVSFNRDIAK